MKHGLWACAGLCLFLVTAAASASDHDDSASEPRTPAPVAAPSEPPALPAPFGVLLVSGFGLGAMALVARRRDPLADAG